MPLTRNRDMGAHKSIHAGKAKLEIGVNFLQKLCSSYPLPPLSTICSASPLSMAIGRFCVKHNNLLGRSEMLDMSWHKGLHDSNLLIAFRRPLPLYVGQPCLTPQLTFMKFRRKLGSTEFPSTNFLILQLEMSGRPNCV